MLNQSEKIRFSSDKVGGQKPVDRIPVLELVIPTVCFNASGTPSVEEKGSQMDD